MPTVSIVSPTYQHAAFLPETIDHVLAQTLTDFEWWVTDDASTDDTVAILQAVRDPRIHIDRLAQHQGIAAASNHALQRAQGTFVAFLATDDRPHPEKLAQQTAYLEAHPDVAAVFTHVHLIAGEGAPFTQADHYLFEEPHMDPDQRRRHSPPHNRFNQPNRTRTAWLHDFFHRFNTLCAPTAMVRRSWLQRIGPENPCLLKTSDFDWWVRLCLAGGNIHVLQTPLLDYRVRQDNSNSSAVRAEEIPLYDWEHTVILQRFLTLSDPAAFRVIFPEASFSSEDPALVPYRVARYALEVGRRHGAMTHQRFAVLALSHMMQDPALARGIAEADGFGYPDLWQVILEADVFNIRRTQHLRQQIQALSPP